MKLALLVFLGYSTMASAGQAQRFQFSPGALLRAELDKTLDANKAKVGDIVIIKLTDDLRWNGEVLASRNSKVAGHITQSEKRRGDSSSVLGIAFDKLSLKSGSDIAFGAIILAIGLPDGVIGGDWVPADQNALLQGGMPGQMAGAAGTMGQPGGYYGEKMPSGTSTRAAVKLSPNARGVLGISGTSLSIGAPRESLISSSKHSVKIESGAQMILAVQ